MNQLNQIDDASIVLKANIYFDGRVISHTILQNGRKKTVGIIYPGTYQFNTQAAERMDILDGTCEVKQAGQSDWAPYKGGEVFNVAGNSSFEIRVSSGLAQYLCSFED